MAKKFILIDQSIASVAGHHYEYAVHVLEAAQRAGYEPFLATHARFAKSSHQSPYKTFPIFRFGFWAAQETAQFGIINWTLGKLGWLRFRWRMFYNYSLFGLLWAVRDRFSDFLLKQPLDRAHIASLATLIPAAILLKLFRFLFLLLLFPVMLAVFLCRSTVRILRAGGFPQTYVRSLLADGADALYFVRQIIARRIRFLSWWQQYKCLVAFRKDTERLLRDIPVGEGDVVFIPTLSGIELMGLAEHLKTRKPGPSWHLLFRRDIFRGRESEWAGQEWRAQGLRNSLAGSVEKLKGHDIRFYTDTEELTAQYNRLGVYPFATVPIPHTHTPRTEVRKGPLRIIYVGDARREKGYHWIPRLVEDLWKDYIVTGRVSFQLQSNFNIPQGEPEAVIAREQLEVLAKRAPAGVQLWKQPMTSEQYKSFLLSGDINLLLYDADNYYARSSGILVESLTAGIPVVVPAGSWLSRQFMDAAAAWRRQLRSAMDVLMHYSLQELRWQLQGNVRSNPVINRELAVSGQAKAFTWVKAPPGAARLLVEVEFGSEVREAVLHVDQVDGRGNFVGTSKSRLMEPAKLHRAVELVELDRQAVKVCIAVGASAAGNVTLRAVNLDFLAPKIGRPNPPASAVGVIYEDASEVSGLLRELIERHEHYSRTAREFSKAWYGYHNADSLVKELVGPPAAKAKGAP